MIKKEKMRLALDFIGTINESGTKTYNFNFLKQLKKKNCNRETLLFITKNYQKKINLRERKNIKIFILPNFLQINFIRILWMQIIFPIHLYFLKVRVLFSPMNMSPLILSYFKIKSVVALHTNIPWINIKLLPGNILRNIIMKKIMEKSLKNAEYILTCSNYARKEIQKKLNFKSKKLKTIYLGVDKKKLREKKIKGFTFKKDFFLSVISCTRYHGILEILKGFLIFKKKYKKKIKFIFVMPILDKYYYNQILLFIKNNFKANEVIIKNTLSANSINFLYKKCTAYIFSSLSEVFGFTTLEALQYNNRVICSKTSSLPEINSKLVTYYRYGDPKDLSKKMFNILKKKKRIINLTYLNKYKWETTFNKTITLLNKIN